jgi:hypothetical protein
MHHQCVSSSGGTYPKQALWEGQLFSRHFTLATLCSFLTGLPQSTVAQLSAYPEIRTIFQFLDEQFQGL